MRRAITAFLRREDGVAALEFAGVATFLAFGVMNVTDIGRYTAQASDLNAAAQSGAEAALVTCDLAHTPATINCSTLQSAVNQAIHASKLGGSVSLSALTEGYYCRTATGGLAQAGSASNKPTDCTGVSNPAGGATPTLYLQVKVAYTFQPLFPDLTIAGNLNPNLTRTAWMRMA